MPVDYDGMDDDQLWAATKELSDILLKQGENLKALVDRRAPPRDPDARRQLISSIKKMFKAIGREENETYDELMRRFHAWNGLDEQG